jgi:hypothetical protein
MALLRIMTTVNPSTAASVVGGSAQYVYNTDNINWLTLASKTGSGGNAFSTFDYQLQGGGIGKAVVKASVGLILASSGATLVS